jgi:putative ABC transport system ATP-binding protein
MTIVGPSGSGKSTLLNLIGLLDRPSAGRYFLLGRDVSQLSEVARSAMRGRHLGFVFQSYQLLEYRTSIENVMIASLYQGGSTAEAYEASMNALRRVGLESKAGVLPIVLSGGERQRVAIARAIASRPAVLLADEPTGNLDSVNAASILALFEELNRAGTTIALITHDPNVAAIGSRRLSIRDGQVEEMAAS